MAESGNELVQDTSAYSSNVAGGGIFLSAEFGQFILELEYLSAIDTFESTLVTMGEDLSGKRPEAWNIEIAWVPADKVQLTARYEQANDFQDDVKRYGATDSYGLNENVIIALEYLRSNANVFVDDTSDAVTTQLAFEF